MTRHGLTRPDPAAATLREIRACMPCAVLTKTRWLSHGWAHCWAGVMRWIACPRPGERQGQTGPYPLTNLRLNLKSP